MVTAVQRTFRLTTDYRKLWLGNAVSNLGDGISFVAVPLLAASLTDNPVLVAGLSVAYSLPRLVVVLLSGALVDRLDRQKLMFRGNIGRAAAMGALGVATLSGASSIYLLYAVFVVLGLLETVADNAAFAILPSVVDKDRLDRANSQIAGTQLVADEFVGPPIGGFLFAVTAALPLLVDAASFAVAAGIFLLLRGNFRSHIAPPEDRLSIRGDIGVGFRWLRQNRFVAALTVLFGLTNLAYMIPFSILVLFARDRLGLSGAGYGLVLSVSAVGGLVGSWLAPRIRRTFGYSATASGALAIGAVSYLVLAVTTNVVLAAVMLATYIFYTVLLGVAISSLMQRLIPDALRGRVSSVNRLFGLVGLTVGALLGGVLVRFFGLTGPFWVAGVLLGVTALGLLPYMVRWERGQRATG